MIIGSMLVKNEEGRYLERVLETMLQVCDKIVVLDDDSDDNTVKICKDAGAEVHCLGQSLWGINESIPRKILWELSTRNDGDWILNLDADETIPNVRRLLHVADTAERLEQSIDGISFNLFDMWSETHYRSDEMWNAHKRDWPMLAKYDKSRDYLWKDGLHCGRFPANAFSEILRSGMDLQHWGWARLEDRQAKYNRYMTCDPEGKYGSMEQYKSILDENPNLEEF